MCVCEFTVTTYDLPVDIRKNTDDIRLKSSQVMYKRSKQCLTKQYTENCNFSNFSPIKDRGEHVLWEG